MANGDIIQKFTKKPKSTKTIDENIEANGNVSVTGDVAVTGTITGNLTGNVTGNLTGNVTGNADTATHAGTADSATTAGSATNDANGDKIDETYLKLTGGTLTGSLTAKDTMVLNGNTGTEIRHESNNTDTGVGIWVGVGAGGVNHGVYSKKFSKWLTYADTNGNVILNGNANTATSATKASQNVGGQDLTTLYPRAGNMGASSFDSVGSGQTLQRSGLYTESIGGTWYNLINVRHRNGESDGTSFGMQIRQTLTSLAKIQYRQQYNGTWQNWRTICPQGQLLYNNTTGTTGTVTLSASAANFQWIEVLYRNNDNAYNSMKVYSPNGKKVWLTTGYIDSTNKAGNIKFATMTISGTSMTKNNYTLMDMATNWMDAQNAIYILQVIGWE